MKNKNIPVLQINLILKLALASYKPETGSSFLASRPVSLPYRVPVRLSFLLNFGGFCHFICCVSWLQIKCVLKIATPSGSFNL